MNETLFYCIIQDSKPLIIQIKRPHSCSFYAIFYAHSKLIFPIPIWVGSDPHYLPHATGCYRPVHLVHNVQFTAFPGHLVRYWDQKEALLYVYGIFEITLAKALADCLGIDTLAWNRGPVVGGLRRLHQSQDREKHLRLRDNFWSCRQSQSKPISVGTKYCLGRLAQASQRTLGLFFLFPFLLRQENHWSEKG